jgi:hypothetical protein
VTVGRIATSYYFIHFLVLFPLLGWFERPRPLPTSVAAAVLAGGHGLGPAGAPMARR